MGKGAVGALIAMLVVPGAAGVVLAQQLMVYPKAGQSEEQQKKDRGECHVWAVEQSGFDPANPPPAPSAATAGTERREGGAVRGAARGAAVGAIAGAIAGDAGKGAAIGAGVGGAGGALKRRDAQQQAQSGQQQAQADYQAKLQRLRDGYNRALKTCLEGRDYSVN